MRRFCNTKISSRITIKKKEKMSFNVEAICHFIFERWDPLLKISIRFALMVLLLIVLYCIIFKKVHLSSLMMNCLILVSTIWSVLIFPTLNVNFEKERKNIIFKVGLWEIKSRGLYFNNENVQMQIVVGVGVEELKLIQLSSAKKRNFFCQPPMIFFKCRHG